MLKDYMGRKIIFLNKKYDLLMDYDPRTKADIQRIISYKIEELSSQTDNELAPVGLETIRRWNKFRDDDMPLGQPGKIEYVEIIAEVLGVEVDDLIIPYEENRRVGKENCSTSEQTEQLLTSQEIEDALNNIKRFPLVKYYLDSILWYFYGIPLGLIEKYRLFKGTSDNYYELGVNLVEIGNQIKLPADVDAFQKGNWIQSLWYKKYIRNKIKFYGVDKLFIITCLKYISKMNIRWYQVISIFYGPRALSKELIQAMSYVLEIAAYRKLQYALPVQDIDSCKSFEKLSEKSAIDYIADAEVVLLPESYERVGGIKKRFDVIERYLNNHGIKLPQFTTRETCRMSNLHDIRDAFCLVTTEGAIIFYDNGYMGDEMLKQQVEAYAYENNIGLLYCRSL